ncbi:MAG TPA: UvrD-helicase domain-containing protein [Burkholderiales bacterium]|nr:UvrD-helicase domain-containing protein [Burkholderiales bacterium]
MSPSFLSGLNEPQLEAVTLPHQSALILAGAGSGKTRVLTTRIAWLIQTGQVSPAGLLAVTFTNKAAKEMLTRISSMLPINTRGMWVGTFHGLCNRMLRAHHRDAGLPQLFQILDSQDQLALIKRLMKAANVDEEKFPPRQIAWYINSQKDEGKRAHEAEDYDSFSRRMKELYAAYDEQCQREGVVDFAELLLRCYELLSKNEVLRDHYRGRFGHILVDEFQDTNRLQYQWLRLLAAGHTVATARGADNAIFAVGDDDQSIYAFRGASAANMQDLQKDFALEKVIKLEQNYRSHGHILDAANALIGHNRRRLGKNLWTAQSKGERLRVYEAATDIDEAGFIVEEVKALHNDGVRLTEMALLYRSNAQSRVLEHALFNAGMSYRVYGGLRFFERQEIKHALAYLRLLASDEDDGALLRIINFPTRGIGNRALEQLQDLAHARAASLWRAAKEKALEKSAREEDSAPTKGVDAFVALIAGMRAACDGLPLPEIIEHVIEHSGLKLHYQNERDGADRLENLDELINAAAGFSADDTHEDHSLTSFLAHAALEAGDNQAQAGADALQLMTVHSAKGLEFHSVFISGLEEGLFPHENSLSEADGREEERRLMYVALTRARRRLYLSFAQSRMLHGQTRYNIASSFFHEIPEPLLKRVNRGNAFAVQEPPPRSAYGKGRVERTPPRALPDTASPWRIGQNVMHPKFGAGVIVGAEGRGADARVQINFDRNGTKWLALEYAKLAPA